MTQIENKCDSFITKKEKKNKKRCRLIFDTELNNSISLENKESGEKESESKISELKTLSQTNKIKNIKIKPKRLRILGETADKNEHSFKENVVQVNKDFITSEMQAESTENANECSEIDSGNIPEKLMRYNPEDIFKTVFVGNVAAQTKKVQIIRLFTWAGNVLSVRFRTSYGTPITSKYKGHTVNAYVVLEDESAASKALELNGTYFNGLHLRVNPSKKLEIEHVKNTVFVGNLTYRANDELLREIFSSCGEIEYVRTVQTEKGCRGIAYVCFKNPEAVGLALELNGTLVDERPIHVERYNQQKKNDQQKKRTELKESTLKQPFKKFQKLDKNRKASNSTNHKKSNFKPNLYKSKTDIKKKSNFRGVKTTLKKKSKKPNKGQTQWLIEKIAPNTMA